MTSPVPAYKGALHGLLVCCIREAGGDGVYCLATGDLPNASGTLQWHCYGTEERLRDAEVATISAWLRGCLDASARRAR